MHCRCCRVSVHREWVCNGQLGSLGSAACPGVCQRKHQGIQGWPRQDHPVWGGCRGLQCGHPPGVTHQQGQRSVTGVCHSLLYAIYFIWCHTYIHHKFVWFCMVVIFTSSLVIYFWSKQNKINWWQKTWFPVWNLLMLLLYLSIRYIMPPLFYAYCVVDCTIQGNVEV